MTFSPTLALIILANSLFVIYVNLRQYRKLCKGASEAALSIFSKEVIEKSTSYNKKKILFDSVIIAAEACKDIFCLVHLEKWHSLFAEFFKKPAVPFVFSYVVANQLFQIPFMAFTDFVIERKYGFNNKTVKVFGGDILLNLFLIVCIGLPFIYITFYIICQFINFELYLGGFIALFQLFIMWVYPWIIAPLYNKFTSLENENLKKKVEVLATGIGFKVSKIEVMDGSKRSRHSNAYFTGFGNTKKIVFYNTILEQLQESEIIAVLAHELGHWKNSHVFKLLILGWIQVFGYIWGFKVLVGDRNPLTVALSLLRFLIGVSCISMPLALLINLISHRFERQADEFAVDLGNGEDLKNGLVKLHTENLSFPTVDWLYSALNFSHPHILERIGFINSKLKKAE